MARAAALAFFAVLTMISATMAVARADGGDAAAGAADFKKTCAVCHTAEAGKNRIGPSLFGVIGRHSGSVADFKYSDAMKSADIIWAPDTLDKYITDPKAVVPNNKMVFIGVKKAEERQDIIAYLATLH